MTTDRKMIKMTDKEDVRSINENEILQILIDAELELSPKEKRYWECIRIHPQKWAEQEFGGGRGGFWAVGIFGQNVLWYNELEDGFILSKYNAYGTINTYNSAEQKLSFLIKQVIRSLEGELTYSN